MFTRRGESAERSNKESGARLMSDTLACSFRAFPVFIAVLAPLYTSVDALGTDQNCGESFAGARAGDEREVAGLKLCWCPPGRFRMGSPPDEPERRPRELQVDVTLTKGFWMGKFEVTQGQWRRVVGAFPAAQPMGEGDDFPVVSVNHVEAEALCRKLTEMAHASKDLPAGWEFRLPTEAQWEYACRAGTTTATSFGNSLGRAQANFQGRPYTTADRPARRWGGPRRSAAIRPTPGACTTCTATSSNGAAIGSRSGCREGLIPTCRRRKGNRTATEASHASAGAGPGPTTAGPAAQPRGSHSSRNGEAITSDCGSWSSGAD